MAIELEGLEFQIEAQSEGAAKGIDALTNSLGKLKNATKGGVGLSSSVKQLQKLDNALAGLKNLDKLNDLGNALGGLSKISNVKISGTIPKRINDIVTSANNITPATIANIQMLTQALQQLGQVGNIRVPNLTNVQQQVQQAQAQATNATQTAVPQNSGVQQVTGQVQQLTTRTNVLKNVLSGMGGVFRKAFSVGTGALKSLASGTAKVTKGFLKMATAIPKQSMSRLIGSIKQTTSSLGGLFSSLKRIAMYRAIRAAIAVITKGFQEGISNLYQYSLLMDGQFARSMNNLATSSQYLKNSFGAMAAPIINALAPAIDFVIDKIVTLLNLINQLIAKLSGASTFTAARKVGKAWADAAGGAGSAAKKAADEIKRYTLGFDELNILGKNKDDDSGSGGGGGAGDTDYASMFEELPIDNAIGDFAQRLREAFDNQDWETLGRLLGGKVNEVFDSIDWAGIGTKLGKGIDGVVKTIYYFLDEVDFRSIGTHFADLLNNTLANIDFSFVGRLLIKPWTSLLDLIIGFITGLDWGLVARSLSDMIKGIFDECTDWLRSVNWSEFGQILWQKIKDFVSNIDYAGIARSFFTFLGTAIRSAVQFLGGFFGSIAEDIKTWWDNDIKGADWKETAGNLLSAIGKGFVNIGQFVLDNIVIPFSEALFDTDWDTIKEVGGNIISGILTGIKDFFVGIGTWIDENIVQPFVQWFKDLFGINSPSTVMRDEVGKFIAEGLLEGIAAPFKAIGQWVKKNILTPIKNAFKEAGLVLETGVELVKEGWETVKGWIGNIPVLKQGIQLVKKAWTTVKQWIGNIPTLDQAIKLIKSGWDTVKNWVGNIPVLNQGIKLVKSAWTTVKAWIGSIPVLNQGIKLVKSAWTTVKAWVGNIPVLNQGIKLVKSAWTTVKAWVGSIPTLKQAIKLAKSGWTSVSNWIGSLSALTQNIKLGKSGWTSVANWVGVGTVTEYVKLAKSGWTSISNFVGTSVSVGISLFKSGWSSIKSFFGLSSGGYNMGHGFKLFESGGAISKRGSEFWNNIPKYADGRVGIHGSLFVAGESGAELVGHVNGRTEVLNKAQLGQVMHRSIVDGMLQFAPYIVAVENKLAQCSNAIISANLASAETLYKGMTTPTQFNTEDVNDWMNAVTNYTGSGFYGDTTTDQMTEAVRQGVYEATARTNDQMREIIERLDRIESKDTTVEVTTNSFTKAINRKNQRDGKTVIPVST